jgi:8-oxo-dGTP pyrophosphatase MutT (NUDIX family)
VGLLEQLHAHRPADRKETEDLGRILDFVSRHRDPFDRHIPEGHLTAAAFVLSARGDRVLLVHHRKLRRWLQPGGHAEPGEREGEAVALREVLEETGIPDVALHGAAPRPLDVDVHEIPAHGSDPPHAHLDLRYLVVAPEGAAGRLAPEESNDLRWFEWRELGGLDLDHGLRRGLAKARGYFPAADPPGR